MLTAPGSGPAAGGRGSFGGSFLAENGKIFEIPEIPLDFWGKERYNNYRCQTAEKFIGRC